MKANSLKNTVVFKTFNFYTILATLAALMVNKWTALMEVIQVTNATDTGDSDYPSAGKTIKDNLPANGKNVTDQESLVAYLTQWITNPHVSLLVRLISGKSRINLKTTYDDFEKQGYTGTSLLRTFVNFVKFTMAEHATALKNEAVLNYVNTATVTELKNNVVMLSVTGTVPMTMHQVLAIETLLLAKYVGKKVIITFEIPGLTGMTCFFGNAEVSERFITEVQAAYNDIENQNKNSQEWNKAGHVLYINGESSIPKNERSQTLNGVITATLKRIGEFSSSAVSPVVA